MQEHISPTSLTNLKFPDVFRSQWPLWRIVFCYQQTYLQWTVFMEADIIKSYEKSPTKCLVVSSAERWIAGELCVLLLLLRVAWHLSVYQWTLLSYLLLLLLALLHCCHLPLLYEATSCRLSAQSNCLLLAVPRQLTGSWPCHRTAACHLTKPVVNTLQTFDLRCDFSRLICLWLRKTVYGQP